MDLLTPKKIITYFAVAVGGLGTLAYHNIKEMNAAFKTLDENSSVVFNSASLCANYKDDDGSGYNFEACKISQARANLMAQGLGTEKSYSTFSGCTINHGNSCAQIIHPSSSCDKDGCIDTTTVTYEPPFVAWQALKQDITAVAVPLYPSVRPDYYVRGDGREFPVAQVRQASLQ